MTRFIIKKNIYVMKHNKIFILLAGLLTTVACASCTDMLWSVGTDVGTDYYSPYYGYDNSIWNNALNGFYGPLWTAPPVYRPPYRPAWNGYNPGPAIRPVRPSGGANRPVTLPARPSQNPEGVSGQPTAPSVRPGGSQRPGNNGRPLPNQ